MDTRGHPNNATYAKVFGIIFSTHHDTQYISTSPFAIITGQVATTKDHFVFFCNIHNNLICPFSASYPTFEFYQIVISPIISNISHNKKLTDELSQIKPEIK